MRILILSHDAEWGGAQKCLSVLLEQLPSEKFQPLVLFPRSGKFAESIRLMGFETVEYPVPWWIGCTDTDAENVVNFGHGFPQRLQGLVNLIREKQIDIVFTNTVTMIDGALAAAEAGVPHVWHLLEHLSLDPALTPLFSCEWVYEFVQEYSDRIIVVSESVRREVLGFAPDARVDVVHTGISPLPTTGRTRVQLLDLEADTIVIAFVGLLSERKGVKQLIAAAPMILARHPQVRFVLCGRDGGVEHEVRRMIQANSLDSVVTLCGERHDIGDVLAVSDVFVMPSLTDPLPVSVLEAMAAGLPVVATNSGGCEEMVEDGVTGLLVPPGDTSALAEAVVTLLSNPDLARRMGTAGRERVTAGFSISRYVTDMTRILETFLASYVPGIRRRERLQKDLRLLAIAAECATAHADRINMQQKLLRAERRLSAIERSWSWRIGSGITSPLRQMVALIWRND